MNYINYILASALGLALIFCVFLGYQKASLLKEIANYKERLASSELSLDMQNKQIQSLALDKEKYLKEKAKSQNALASHFSLALPKDGSCEERVKTYEALVNTFFKEIQGKN